MLNAKSFGSSQNGAVIVVVGASLDYDGNPRCSLQNGPFRLSNHALVEEW
jgi:hypothetical protein